jgi:hypothetical protein
MKEIPTMAEAKRNKKLDREALMWVMVSQRGAEKAEAAAPAEEHKISCRLLQGNSEVRLLALVAWYVETYRE